MKKILEEENKQENKRFKTYRCLEYLDCLHLNLQDELNRKRFRNVHNIILKITTYINHDISNNFNVSQIDIKQICPIKPYDTVCISGDISFFGLCFTVFEMSTKHAYARHCTYV